MDVDAVVPLAAAIDEFLVMLLYSSPTTPPIVVAPAPESVTSGFRWRQIAPCFEAFARSLSLPT